MTSFTGTSPATAGIFPIDRAAATITLPSPARFSQRAAYTGAQGSTAKAARVIAEEPGTIRFQATRPLDPNEGLTVAVAFPKGVIADPAASVAAGLVPFGLGTAAGWRGRSGRSAGLPFLCLAQGRPRSHRRERSFRYFPRPTSFLPQPCATSSNGSSTIAVLPRPWSTPRSRAMSGWSRRTGGFFRSNERRIERNRLPGAQPLAATELASLNALVEPDELAGHGTEEPCHLLGGDEGAERANLPRPMTAGCSTATTAGSAPRSSILLAALVAGRGRGRAGRKRRPIAAGAAVLAPASPSPPCCSMPRPTTKAPGVPVASRCARLSAAQQSSLGFPIVPEALNTGQWLPSPFR